MGIYLFKKLHAAMFISFCKRWLELNKGYADEPLNTASVIVKLSDVLIFDVLNYNCNCRQDISSVHCYSIPSKPRYWTMINLYDYIIKDHDLVVGYMHINVYRISALSSMIINVMIIIINKNY